MIPLTAGGCGGSDAEQHLEPVERINVGPEGDGPDVEPRPTDMAPPPSEPTETVNPGPAEE